MDGTLIDTEPLWGKATFELGELLGRPLTPEVRARTIGGSFPNTLSVVAEWAGYELKDGDLERYRTWMSFYALEASPPSINISLEIQRGLAFLGVVVFHTLVNPPAHHARWDGNEKDGRDGDNGESRHGGLLEHFSG